MADEPGALTQEQLESLNLFLNDKALEEGIPCPVTGEATPLTEWNAPSHAVTLPGPDGSAGYEALPLTSPAGGVVLISVVKLKQWQDGETEKTRNGEKDQDAKRT